MNCSLDGCAKPHLARGFCTAHYRRWRLYGDPLATSPAKRPEARFAGRYRVTEAGCWHWTGDINSMGYARLSVDGKKRLAHRWAYERFVGSIPVGLVLDHLCRNRACVNPEHLEPVTQSTNVLRAKAPLAASPVAGPTSHPGGHE